MYCQYCDKLVGSTQSVAEQESRHLQCKMKRMQQIIHENHKDVIYHAMAIVVQLLSFSIS